MCSYNNDLVKYVLYIYIYLYYTGTFTDIMLEYIYIYVYKNLIDVTHNYTFTDMLEYIYIPCIYFNN